MKNKHNPSEFDLEYQYQQYLQRVQLDEKTMHPQQKKQIKEAFYGAIGIVLVAIREEGNKISEAELVTAYQSMLDQVGNFFLKKGNKQN